MRAIVMVALATVGFAVSATVTAEALPAAICVPAKASSAVKTPNAEGKCPAENKAEYIVNEEQAKFLEHVTYSESGPITHKPQIQVNDLNVILNAPAESGEGNLWVGGYEKKEAKAIGTNNLIVGLRDEFSGEGNIIDGEENVVEGNYNIVGGKKNHAAKSIYLTNGPENSTLFGIEGELTSGIGNSVLGGFGNVVGELHSNAEAEDVVGGVRNHAYGAGGDGQVVVSGRYNETKAYVSAVLGGESNLTEGTASTILGGHSLKTTKEYEINP